MPIALVVADSSCTRHEDDGAGEEKAATATHEEKMTSAGIERVIPLRFIKTFPGGQVVWENDVTFHTYTEAQVMEGIRLNVERANERWRDAGIQFYISRFDDCSTGGGNAFHTVGNGDEYITWTTARNSLTCAFPLGAQPSPAPWWGSANDWRAKKSEWITWASTFHADPTEIPVWVVNESVGAWSAYAWAGKGVVNGSFSAHLWTWAPGWFPIAPDVLAHELGHSLGLEHTFGTEYYPFLVDPSTGSNFQLSSHWDLVYSGNAQDPQSPRFFVNQTGAHTYESELRQIETTDGVTCTVNDNAGSLRCVVAQGQSYQYTATYPNNDPKNGLKGLAFTTTEPNKPAHGTNLMSYRSLTPNLTAVSRTLTYSQIQTVKKYLRFEAPLQGYPGRSAQLTKLGQGITRPPIEHLDFDNDGLRDIAFWTPAIGACGGGAGNGCIQPNQSGTYKVLLSSRGYADVPGQAISVAFGRPGDVMVPADYNGDGYTDIAIFQPGGGSSRNEPFNQWAAKSPESLVGGSRKLGT